MKISVEFKDVDMVTDFSLEIELAITGVRF